MSDEVIESPHGDGLVVPEGWVWQLVDVTCSSCDAVNQLHEQPPEWLATKAGVKWECNACGAANRLGGVDVEDVPLRECGECHSTFDGRDERSTVDVDVDGSWTCPVCSTPNRDVTAHEHASSTEGQEVTV